MPHQRVATQPADGPRIEWGATRSKILWSILQHRDWSIEGVSAHKMLWHLLKRCLPKDDVNQSMYSAHKLAQHLSVPRLPFAPFAA